MRLFNLFRHEMDPARQLMFTPTYPLRLASHANSFLFEMPHPQSRNQPDIT